MFIKQRRVRKSERFTSRWSRSSSKRREYVASLYTTAVIQAFLALFLSFLARQAIVMMREKFPELVWYLKYAIPFFIVVVAAIVLRALIMNVRDGIAAYRHAPKPPNA
ncbi:MAG: hypothetical protein ACE5EO_00450 [Candidatus Krumholzibacteriia bacterium]